MSAPTITPDTAAPAAEPTRRSLLPALIGGGSGVAVLAALAIALWPASEADKAYDDGVRFGDAVAQLQSADTNAEVDAALDEVHAAASDTRTHADERVAEQVTDQEDALVRAVDGYTGALAADDAFEQDLYEAELDVALDDLAGNAEDVREESPDVVEAFWNGYDDGLGEA